MSSDGNRSRLRLRPCKLRMWRRRAYHQNYKTSIRSTLRGRTHTPSRAKVTERICGSTMDTHHRSPRRRALTRVVCEGAERVSRRCVSRDPRSTSDPCDSSPSPLRHAPSKCRIELLTRVLQSEYTRRSFEIRWMLITLMGIYVFS